jgi:hypothetical protein
MTGDLHDTMMGYLNDYTEADWLDDIRGEMRSATDRQLRAMLDEMTDDQRDLVLSTARAGVDDLLARLRAFAVAQAA